MFTRGILLFILLASFEVNAQSFNAIVSNDSILLGNHFKITFEIENLDGDFEQPNLEDFQILSGPNISSSIQIVNGETSSKKSYSYLLRPNELGTYTILPSYIITKDKTLETLPIEIKVYPNPDNIIQQQEEDNPLIFDFGSPFKKEKERPLPNSEKNLKRI